MCFQHCTQLINFLGGCHCSCIEDGKFGAACQSSVPIFEPGKHYAVLANPRVHPQAITNMFQTGREVWNCQEHIITLRSLFGCAQNLVEVVEGLETLKCLEIIDLADNLVIFTLELSLIRVFSSLKYVVQSADVTTSAQHGSHHVPSTHINSFLCSF